MDRIGSKDFKAETTEISTSSAISYQDLKRQEIAVQMFYLATARQATLSKAVMDSYSKALLGFAIEDIRAAVALYGTQERAEGRTAMPSLGEITAACQRAAQRRHEASAQDRRKQESDYARAHPEEFLTWKELLQDMQVMQDACAAALGVDFRKHYRPVYNWQGRVMKEFGLCELYAQVMEGRVL